MKSNLKKELAAALGAGRFDITAEGIVFPVLDVLAQGEYFDRINGGEWMRTPNLVTTEGLAHILNIALGGKAKATNHYIALFKGSASPASNWTAASFTATADEIVSPIEGYTNATRPVWTSTDTTTGSIDNLGSVASLTIATASTLNVTGAALLTASGKGATTGSLVSATKYAATRTFQNGDTYDVGYRLNLTV